MVASAIFIENTVNRPVCCLKLLTLRDIAHYGDDKTYIRKGWVLFRRTLHKPDEGCFEQTLHCVRYTFTELYSFKAAFQLIEASSGSPQNWMIWWLPNDGQAWWLNEPERCLKGKKFRGNTSNTLQVLTNISSSTCTCGSKQSLTILRESLLPKS